MQAMFSFAQLISLNGHFQVSVYSYDRLIMTLFHANSQGHHSAEGYYGIA